MNRHTRFRGRSRESGIGQHSTTEEKNFYLTGERPAEIGVGTEGGPGVEETDAKESKRCGLYNPIGSSDRTVREGNEREGLHSTSTGRI